MSVANKLFDIGRFWVVHPDNDHTWRVTNPAGFESDLWFGSAARCDEAIEEVIRI